MIIQNLEDMLRACVLDFGGNWEDHMSLVEFSYNNNFQKKYWDEPYEALYGKKCRSPICRDDVGERKLLSPDLVQLQKKSVNTRKVENNTKLT